MVQAASLVPSRTAVPACAGALQRRHQAGAIPLVQAGDRARPAPAPAGCPPAPGPARTAAARASDSVRHRPLGQRFDVQIAQRPCAPGPRPRPAPARGPPAPASRSPARSRRAPAAARPAGSRCSGARRAATRPAARPGCGRRWPPRPGAGRSVPAATASSVDLPAPRRPLTTTSSPASITRFRLSSTGWGIPRPPAAPSPPTTGPAPCRPQLRRERSPGRLAGTRTGTFAGDLTAAIGSGSRDSRGHDQHGEGTEINGHGTSGNARFFGARPAAPSGTGHRRLAAADVRLGRLENATAITSFPVAT